MSGLNLSFKIPEAIENGLLCLVCKSKLQQEKARVGFRIRDSAINIRLHGYNVIYHFMNTEVLCGPVCAEKFSLSWETKKAQEKIPEHIAKINKSIELFKTEAKQLQEKESKFLPKKKSNDRRSKGKN